MGARKSHIGGEKDSSGEGLLFREDEEDIKFPMKDEIGNDLDLDAMDTIKFQVYPYPEDFGDSSKALIEKSKSGGGITTENSDEQENSVSETAVVTLVSNDTTDMAKESSESFVYQLWVEDSESKNQTMFYGDFTVHPSPK